MKLQIKGTPTALLVVGLVVVSVTLTFALTVHLSPAAAGQCKVYLVQQGGEPQLELWMNGSHTVVNVTFQHGKYQAYNGWWLIGDKVEVDVDGVSHVITICVGECATNRSLITDCPHDAGGWESPHKYYHTLSYDLGVVTGDPPKVRVRVRTMDCASNMIQAGDALIKWSDWTPLQEAVVWQPPILEAAVVIGVVSIAIGVGNNYLQGRREQKATEVTRTAAEDERFMDLYDASRDPAFQESLAAVLYQYQWTDYEEFHAKYGPQTNVKAWAQIQSVAQYFEGIGVLVTEGSVDIGRVYRLLATPIIRCWEKLEGVILEQRKRDLSPHVYASFEALYYAIQKFQREGPPPRDDVPVHRFE